MDIRSIVLSKQTLLLVLAITLLAWVCYDGLALMVSWWERDEYSHGYMIPLVALYLLWQKRFLLAEQAESGSYLGALVLLGALIAWLLGELSAIYTIIQYAFFIGLFGLALLWVGIRGTLAVWAPIFYLIFMIPLPNFLYFNLSQELQLISSSIGVFVIRLFDISVFLEGNVIDLGTYQLQVVEACNGLQYLFPLMSFGFLIGYIYRGPVWQKLIIFLSTIPITVLMNSFRIGVIGVTVEYFGELFDLDFGAGREEDQPKAVEGIQLASPAWLGLTLLILAVPTSMYFAERQDLVPERSEFIDFPIEHNGWVGRLDKLDGDVLDVLKLSDYHIANYYQEDDAPVNFYVAWYQEQRMGASIHSPKSCLPGGGWVIKQHTIETVSGVDRNGQDLTVNRVNMQMGNSNQLVYYWFEGRSRNITNEYMAKWFIFWDSLTRQRTDGALVRIVTYVPEGTDLVLADQRLVQFIKDFDPLLPAYIPN